MGFGQQACSNEEFDQLVSKADPNVPKNKSLFNDIGQHCCEAEQTYSSLRRIIMQLRDDDVFLADEASFHVAKMYIWEAHNGAKSETIDQYVRNLRALLRCQPEQVPMLPSITGTLPHWQCVGDEVDCLLDVARASGSRDLTLEWWHCIILSVAGTKSVLVYWVGIPPKSGTRRQLQNKQCNPSTVLRKDLRSHWHDAYVGHDLQYNAAWIRQQYISQTHGSDPVCIVPDAAIEVVEDDQGKQKPPGDSARCASGKGDGKTSNGDGKSESKQNPPKPPRLKPKPKGKKDPAPLPADKSNGSGKGKPNMEPAEDQIMEFPSGVEWFKPFLVSDRMEQD